MNGLVEFELTTNGWRVGYIVSRLPEPHVQREVVNLSAINVLMIKGRFNRKLRVGQFCQRPHTYLKGI